MNIYKRVFKVLQSCAHSIVSKFEDPVKLAEQGIRDLKRDFDESMKNVAEVKAIAIGVKKQKEMRLQTANDYEQKAILLLKKADNNEISKEEADRLATAALQKKQEALKEAAQLDEDVKKYDFMLEKMEKKVLDLKNQIKKWEAEYTTLKARAVVAKNTKKINMQLSEISSDSTTAMLEEMKKKISAEENLAEAYENVAVDKLSIDEEINNALGGSVEAQSALQELKQKLITEKKDDVSDIDTMKNMLDGGQ